VTRSFALTGDLATSYVIAACVLAALSLALLVVELVRRRRVGGASARVAASGALAVLALLAAVLRPVTVTSSGHLLGPKVVVLADLSRSMDLPAEGGTRREVAARALAQLASREGVRLSPLGFGEGAAVPLVSGEPSKENAAPGSDPRERRGRSPLLGSGPAGRPAGRSDLGGALESVARAADERPAAIVVISDGRLDRPAAEGAGASARAALEALEVAGDGAGDRPSLPPIHTVAVATDSPPDASVRAVRTAGAAVAHQQVSLRVEIGCSGGLGCDEAIPVVARELREEGAPTSLASGEAHVTGGSGTVELPITLDRAGTRILEVQIKAPSGDEIPENDTRYVAVDVARDRIRVLHVAGRPTYDVRALRMWLKSDASVDVVAFFILRTPTDEVVALSEELALIPFPVDELFSVHLPSFDAVVLQDFDAAPYGLTKHLPALAQYVDRGGGLIMVGGPNAFVPGNYARTPLARVLPVGLDIDPGQATPGTDAAAFAPRLTPAGRVAPVLQPLLQLVGDELPQMPGTNVVGDAMPGSTVLLTHPSRKTPRGAPMPVLALGERGSGRTIALTVDGSHRLLFSAFASSSAGRAHGAFWDALLGWLMRDPRFEPAVISPRGGCIAGEETTLLLSAPAGPAAEKGAAPPTRPSGGATPESESESKSESEKAGGVAPGSQTREGEATVTIKRLGSGEVVQTLRAALRQDGEPVEIAAGKLEPGGYSATVEIGGASGAEAGVGAKGPSTRRDFACERGGDEWADPRPDVQRLREIAEATGGRSVMAGDVASLPLPEGTRVVAERHVAPLAPPWIWTLTAAAMLGLHWIVRRRAGLS